MAAKIRTGTVKMELQRFHDKLNMEGGLGVGGLYLLWEAGSSHLQKGQRRQERSGRGESSTRMFQEREKGGNWSRADTNPSCLQSSSCGRSHVSDAQTDAMSVGNSPASPLCLCVLFQSGQDGSSQRPAPTRIPMSKGMKAGKPVVAAPGAGNLTKFEARAETQSMKIELKKSAASSAAPLGAGKG